VAHSNTVQMFDTADELMEIGSDKLFISSELEARDKVCEVAASKLHENIGGTEVFSFVACLYLIVGLNDRDNIGVGNLFESGLVSIEWANGFIFMSKDFQGEILCTLS